MNKTTQLGVLLLSVIFQSSCVQTSKNIDLQTGDILFCSYQTGELSSAIDKVTQTHNETHYSHMGLVEIENRDTFVIHASLKRGVVKERLQEFFQIDQPTVVDVFRISDSLQFSVNEALNKANHLIGLPYNAHYRMTDTCFYCSQLVYEVFKANEIFTLEPMTFKNPETGAYNQAWINHYKAIGLEIPEGELGCNPNGMATSAMIDRVGKLK